MGVNKVEYGGNTLIDLTSDTVTADKMLASTRAHDKTGSIITGSIPSYPEFEGRIVRFNSPTNRGSLKPFNTATYDSMFHLDAGYYPAFDIGFEKNAFTDLKPENVRKNYYIYGVLGTYEGEGEKGELVTLWVNPSPTKSFAAQTVALDLSKYAGVLIYSKTNVNTSGDGLGQFCMVDGVRTTLHCAWATSYTRYATISETGVIFDAGRNNAVSPPSVANSSCIPTKIVGIVATPRNIEYKYHEAFLTTSSKMTIDCGFRPTRIMINVGVLDTGISDSNYKANIVIDANGYWTDVHTNSSGGGSGYNNRIAMGSTAMGCTWNITNTGFEITCTNSNFTARKWCFTIVGE